MGRNPATTDFIARLTELEKPLILDADAIYHAAAMPEKIQKRKFPQKIFARYKNMAHS